MTHRRRVDKKSQGKKWLASIGVLLVLALAAFALLRGFSNTDKQQTTSPSTTQTSTKQEASTYQVSEQERAHLDQRFNELNAVNPETVSYIYAPGTNLDEPVVQTNDNSTYLDKTFDGGHEPYLGTVFMDKDNQKDYSDRLTWLFGHARGSQVPDSRMFNDVNFYSSQDYFNAHPYVVVETPERTYYYEAMAMIIVPEETAFYRTEFTDDDDFTTQLKAVYDTASVKNPNITVNAKDKYLVLSTCLEDDETIRSNLYLRQIPDEELPNFLATNGDSLAYTPTR